jgi:Tol biopolymer transport system component
LWVRRLDSLEAQPLTGTNGASYPFWSPDGRFIGFFADGRLKRIDATGTSLQTICDLPTNLGGARGGTWSRDGVILFAVEPFGPEPIYRVSAGGGEPTPVATLEASSELQHHHWPSFLPDGRRFLYSVVSSIGTAKERTGIYLASLDAAGARMLIGVASNAVYVPGSASEQRGYILFAREQNLMAAPFDASRSEITGAEMVVAGGVGLEPAYGATFGDFSVSETGVLVYGSGGGDSQLRWFDRTGKVLGSLGAPTRDMDFRISPDGSQIVAQREDRHGGTNLWLLDTTRGTPVRFTAGPSYNAAPVWSHDGGHITFFSVREGRWQLWDKEASGRSDERPVLKSNNKDLVAHDWSPDGRNLLYNDIDPITRRGDLWILPTGTTEPTPLPFTRTEFNENFGRFSPDGRWITYVSDESGRNEVYVQSFRPSDGRIGKVRISTDGGIEPRWPRKGNEIFYIGPDNMLIAVEVKTGDTLGVGASRALFPTRPVGVLRYDVSPDGRRFLVAVPMEEMVSSPATVVLDWQEELKELVPTR